jgi:hypothetical protein
MKYYWLSFSKLGPSTESNNLGAVVISSEDELDPKMLQAQAHLLGLVPDGTVSFYGGPLPEDVAADYPHNVLMSREELGAREDVVSERTQVCSNCAAEHTHDDSKLA